MLVADRPGPSNAGVHGGCGRDSAKWESQRMTELAYATGFAGERSEPGRSGGPNRGHPCANGLARVSVGQRVSVLVRIVDARIGSDAATSLRVKSKPSMSKR